MVTQQSYFYEINIDWAKSPSWVCQSTSKLVIKIIKAFFFRPSNRSVRCLWNFNEKVAFVGLPDKFGNATFSMVVGNVFVNNYQKYFLINAFLSIQLDSIRCDAKQSLLLNFFLIDFSRANLGMHWHQARPEAPLPRCPDAPMHMSIVRRIACLVAAVRSFPLHFSKTVCLPKFMCIFHCFLFSSSLHFCIFFL